MKKRRPKAEFAVEDMVYKLSRKFEYPDLDTKPKPGSFGERGYAPSIVVASSTAPDSVKAIATPGFVCTGVDDQDMINEAFVFLGGNFGGGFWHGRILLTEGDFYIRGTNGSPFASSAGAIQTPGMDLVGMGMAGGESGGTRLVHNGGGTAGSIVSTASRVQGIQFVANDDTTAVHCGAGATIITDCQFTGDAGHAVLIDAGDLQSNKVIVENSRFEMATGFAVCIGDPTAAGPSPTVDVTVRENSFEFCGGKLIYSNWGNGLVIKDNYAFDGSENESVHLENCFNVQMAGNTWKHGGFDNASPTIRVTDSQVVTINDTLESPNASGILIEGTSTDVHVGSGTTIYEADQHGIRITADRNKVSNAIIIRSGRDTNNTYDNVLIEGDDNSVSDITSVGGGGNEPRYGVNVASGDGNTILHVVYGAEADYGTGSFNDAGTNTIHCRPEDTCGGGGGSPGGCICDLAELGDVDLTGLSDGDFLQFDSGSGDWLAVAVSPGTDANAIHDNVPAEIDALTQVSPVAGDWVIIEDASDSFNKKKVDVDDLGGAGGANVPEWITYLAERMPDETPHADDDFFDDATLPGTQLTVSGAADFEERYGIHSIIFSGQTANDAVGTLIPLTSPSAPLTIETAITVLAPIADFYNVGIGFTDGVTSADDVAMLRWVAGGSTASGDQLFWQDAGTLTNIQADIHNNLADFRLGGGLLYIRIVWTAANTFETQVSSNGFHWMNLGAAFSKTLTPTHALLFAGSQGAAAPGAIASFHYLRRNDNDPT